MANISALDVHIANKKSEIGKKKKLLEESVKKSVKKPLQDAIERILESKGIVRQQYHSQSLIGNHCDRLLEHHEWILSQIEEVLLNKQLRRLDLEESIDNDIHEFITMIRESLQLLEAICLLMARVDHQASDLECRQFEKLVTDLGKLWRRTDFDQSCSVKLHGLECVGVKQFWDFRTLGQFSEEPTETLHHLWKIYHRHYANVVGYERHTKVILATDEQRNMPEVQAIIDTVKYSRKRKWSEATLAAKESKKNDQIRVKILKVELASNMKE